jgi:hypothetical protein
MRAAERIADIGGSAGAAGAADAVIRRADDDEDEEEAQRLVNLALFDDDDEAKAQRDDEAKAQRDDEAKAQRDDEAKARRDEAMAHRDEGNIENEMQSSDETSARNTARKSFIFRPSVLRMALLSLYIVFLSSRSCCSVESSKSRVFRRRVPSLWGFENETAFRIRWLAARCVADREPVPRAKLKGCSHITGLSVIHIII